MGRNITSLVIFVTFLTMIGLRTTTSVKAQDQNSGWTEFTDISNTPTSSTYPCIVADSSGNVHVLWSEDVGGKTRNIQFGTDGAPALDSRGKVINTLTESGNTLYYTHWDGQRWSTPIDVAINPSGRIEYPQAAVDIHGVLHVVWIATEGQQANLVYSQVSAEKAASVNDWTMPVILAESVLYAYYPADIATDQTGGIHILYSQIGAEPGDYVINSYDGGRTWSSPQQLFATSDTTGTGDGVSPVRILSDQTGRLHATWTRFGSDGNGKAIYYSQSRDLGRSWTKPIAISVWQPGWYEVDWLSAGVVGDEIHLVWEGNDRSAALFERISLDGGSNWGEPHRILTSLVGENGYADMPVDSAGQLYQLVVKRGDPDSLTNGVWFALWQNSHWQDPVLLGTSDIGLYSQLSQLQPAALSNLMQDTLTGNGLRYQRSAIVNGNELFVVVVNEWDGEIWSSHTVLSAPRIEPKPYPQATAAPTAAPTVTPVFTAKLITTPVVSVNGVISPERNDTGDPILVSSLIILGLISIALIRIGFQRIHK